MKTLTVTHARKRLGAILARVLKGEDIGIVHSATGNIIVLRPASLYSDDYALMERVAGETPWVADIHVFAIASTMSFGASGSSINAMTTAVPKLVHGLTRGLFRADIERHWASFRAYDVPQAVVERQTQTAGEER